MFQFVEANGAHTQAHMHVHAHTHTRASTRTHMHTGTHAARPFLVLEMHAFP